MGEKKIHLSFPPVCSKKFAGVKPLHTRLFHYRDDEMLPHYVIFGFVKLLKKILKINQIVIEYSPEPNSCCCLTITAVCFLFPHLPPPFLSHLSISCFHHLHRVMTKIDRSFGSWRKRWIFKIGHLSLSSHCIPSFVCLPLGLGSPALGVVWHSVRACVWHVLACGFLLAF